MIGTDGSWSVDYDHEDNQQKGKISTGGRPRLYYFEVLDCDNEIGRVYRTGNLPRFVHKVSITTDKGTNEFSFEDIGLLQLHGVLFFALLLVFGLLGKSFYKFFQEEGKWLAPHPVMLYALSAQMTAIMF